MKINKYYTLGIVPKSNRKNVKTDAKSIPLTQIYMIANFSVLVQAFQ